MGDLKGFQLVLLGAFAFFAIAGVIGFSVFRGGSGSEESFQPVTLWGTVEFEIVDGIIRTFNTENEQRRIDLTYREIRPDVFDQTLTEALAENRGPDMVLLSQDQILDHQAKLLEIPFESIPERTFKDRFIEEGELFLTPTGVLGTPFIVDPLVLYWNRTLFSNAGVALPPKNWAELPGLVDRLTVRTEQNTITQSAIAFGEFSNIDHAKEILTTLLLQAGNKITTRRADGKVIVIFGEVLQSEVQSAIRLYTSFVNPTSELYSWNRSWPEARDAFLAGDLAMYVGYASELFELQEQNPNLNFDIALMPQTGEADRTTFGKLHSVAIVGSTQEAPSALNALSILSGVEVGTLLDERLGLPPVRRDILSAPPVDAFRSVFYESALIADAFLDPDSDATEQIFQDMIEDITSGRTQIARGVGSASVLLKNLLE